MVQPYRELKRSYGVDVTFEYGDKPLQNSGAPDLLVFQRAINPQTSAMIKMIHENRDESRLPRMIMDLDDDIWTISGDNSAHWFYSKRWVRESLTTNLAYMDAVTVSTEPLAEVVRRQLPLNSETKVYVVGNAIPDRITKPSMASYEPRNTASSGLVVLWQGSNTHRGDFSEIATSVDRFLKTNRGHKLFLVGDDYRDLLDVSVTGQVEVLAANGPTATHSLVASIGPDVILAPLSENTFNRSKSNLRILEALGLGVPVIATDFGPYSGTSPGVLRVPSDTQWDSALEQMTDPEFRRSLSVEGRSWATTQTTSMRAAEYQEIITEVMAA